GRPRRVCGRRRSADAMSSTAIPYDRAMHARDTNAVQAAIERTFREESGRILASLIRACRDFDLAEDALQDAFAAAAQRWPLDGVPDNCGAWIMTAARRKMLDLLRRAQTLATKAQMIAATGPTFAPGAA